MDDLIDQHGRAMDGFDLRVRAVRTDQWHAPTPCEDWDVRDLVNHLVFEQLWMPPLLSGATVEEVGDRYDGDQLGDEPLQAWEGAASDARAAVTAPGALDGEVHLSYGDRDARGYVLEMTADLVVHTWDLARAVGGDETLDPGLVALVTGYAEPQLEHMAASGLFDPPVEVSDDADPQTRLLAMFGRRVG
jgi:uncharacterized protein (TIGR03086 family)